MMWMNETARGEEWPRPDRGGFGHAYGSPNWNFPKNWREVLELPGANSLGSAMKTYRP